MYYYVCIRKINGRNDFYQLAKTLDEHGYDDRVEYHAGGELAHSDDNFPRYVDSHLRFLDEQDALAYALTYGGKVTREIPVYMLAGG